MKYAVDRVEGNIAVLEDLKTGKIKEVSFKSIGFKVKEKDILIYKNNKYIKSDKEKEERLKLIQEKFNKVKSK